jgi:hypothetical protein
MGSVLSAPSRRPHRRAAERAPTQRGGRLRRLIRSAADSRSHFAKGGPGFDRYADRSQVGRGVGNENRAYAARNRCEEYGSDRPRPVKSGCRKSSWNPSERRAQTMPRGTYGPSKRYSARSRVSRLYRGYPKTGDAPDPREQSAQQADLCDSLLSIRQLTKGNGKRNVAREAGARLRLCVEHPYGRRDRHAWM